VKQLKQFILSCDIQGQYDRHGSRPDQYRGEDVGQEEGMLSDERAFNRDRRMMEYSETSIGRPRDRERERSDRDRSRDKDRKRRRSEEKSR